MASLVANDANAVVVDAGLASPPRVASSRVATPHAAGDTTGRPYAALPARSATLVRIAGLAVLCTATLVAPALLLVWMPIVLGVPHVASDIRFLVLPLPRRQLVLALAACSALVALKAASLVSGVPLLHVEMAVVATWLLAMLVLVQPTRRSHALARHAVIRPRKRTEAVWLTGLIAAFAIIMLPITFAFVAALAHNFVAVIAWIAVKRPARRHAIAVIAVIGAAVAMLLLAGPAVASFTGGDASPWLTVDQAAGLMFRGLPLETGRALIIAFAFLQAVHYAIWLDWIPRGAPLTSDAARSTRRARLAGLAVAGATLVVIGAALVDAAWARTTYLALATFHIYLELVILGAWLARRVQPRSLASAM
ncbi:MAG TPA: hypothetical protein VIV11_04830 [Kofleriaceae bacterium]